MPYCCQCGKVVQDRDVFCAHCGARQPNKAGAAKPFDPGVSPRSACVLCYIPFVGWVASIVVLAAERYRSDRNVRFHAFQGLYLFVAWLLVDWVVRPMFRYVPDTPFHLGGLLELVVLGVWIYMIIKTSQNQDVSLPILGELAERSLAER